jgi:hypothetical protein
LAAEHPARLVVTELDTASQGSVEAWAAALKDQHKIKHVDVGSRGRHLQC